MIKKSTYKGRSVYVVDGSRTPFLKAKGIGPFSAADLAVQAGQSLMSRLPIQAKDIGQVIIGCAMPSPDEANIARNIALRLGCGNHVPAWTVHRNCGSGLQAIDNAAHVIASGRSELILAGGVDVMSRAPLIFGNRMVKLFQAMMMAKTFGQKNESDVNVQAFVFDTDYCTRTRLDGSDCWALNGANGRKFSYQFNISRHRNG